MDSWKLGSDIPLGTALGGLMLLDWFLTDGGFGGRVGGFPRLYQSSSPTKVEPRVAPPSHLFPILARRGNRAGYG